MFLRRFYFATLFPFALAVFGAPVLYAGTSDVTATVAAESGTRYGLWGLLDHRSEYGKGVFPEPFIVDDSDGESGEVRLDWLHSTSSGAHSDAFKGEIEQGFGLLTVEVAAHYERSVTLGQRLAGFGSVEVGVRHPLFQYVSPGGIVDNTFGGGFELAIPTESKIGNHYESVPKLFNDLRLGNHFTMQTLLGFSMLSGGGEEGGTQTFEYGVTVGYTLRQHDLPIPGVQAVIPVFEFYGERLVNHAGAGENSVLANAAIRVNLSSIGPVQPRLGIGYVFPLNRTARESTNSGIFTSLVFDY